MRLPLSELKSIYNQLAETQSTIRKLNTDMIRSRNQLDERANFLASVEKQLLVFLSQLRENERNRTGNDDELSDDDDSISSENGDNDLWKRTSASISSILSKVRRRWKTASSWAEEAIKEKKSADMRVAQMKDMFQRAKEEEGRKYEQITARHENEIQRWRAELDNLSAEATRSQSEILEKSGQKYNVRISSSPATLSVFSFSFSFFYAFSSSLLPYLQDCSPHDSPIAASYSTHNINRP